MTQHTEKEHNEYPHRDFCHRRTCKNCTKDHQVVCECTCNGTPIFPSPEKEPHNTQESWEEKVNVFIRKWCSINAPHLLDNDDNDGERLRQFLQKQAEEISEVMEGLKKKVCELCGNSIESSPHWEENGIYFCPCSNHTCRGKNSTAPCINIAGDEKDIGYNKALSDTLLAIKQVMNK